MGAQIIKADRAVDLYIEWSSVVEAPTFVGTRDEVLAHLMWQWNPEDTERYGFELGQAKKRLDRADETGTSAYPPWGCGWDDHGETRIVPLLEPFEDEPDDTPERAR